MRFSIPFFIQRSYPLLTVLSLMPQLTHLLTSSMKHAKRYGTIFTVCSLISIISACDGTFPTKPLEDNEQEQEQQAQSTASGNKDNGSPIDNSANNPANNSNDDLWSHIRHGYQLNTKPLSNTIPAIGEQRINGLITRYRKHPKDIFQQTEQARLYLHHIVSELEKNNMPTELALIPFVESRFDPFAYSSGRASGLWQFIPGTGERFNMTQTWWHDERRDVIKSTQAAIDYFNYLHRFFDNDWLLAIAAYNAGEGTVKRAIKRNKKVGKATDFWSLPLPKQTQFYVPKLFVWARIIDTPEHYALSLSPIQNTAVFTAIDIQSQIDLATFSEISNMNIDDVYALNPAYNRWATDPQAPHELLVPLEKADNILTSLQSYPIEKRMQWQRYTVKPNDALSFIAKRFNTNTRSIQKANKLASSRIRVGQTLLIPTASKQSDFYQKSAEQRLAVRQNTSKKKNKNKKVKYITQAGDTLWSIGKKYQVKPSSIAYWNNMSEKDVLKKKQALVIWQDNATLAQLTLNNSTNDSAEKRKVLYTVKSGDNLSFIAQRFSVSTKDIREWNDETLKKYLKPGQVLKLFVTVANRTL
jgi:membrane-bound lytic murein transglycosylase D